MMILSLLGSQKMRTICHYLTFLNMRRDAAPLRGNYKFAESSGDSLQSVVNLAHRDSIETR